MKAVTEVVNMLKDSGTTRQMSEELYTYEEYEEVVKFALPPFFRYLAL